MLLDIAILSYNRTHELARALQSFETIVNECVRVVVYEDCSPNQAKIEKICSEFQDILSIPLVYCPGSTNVGYDRNLLRAFDTDSDFTLLLSDDDFVDPVFFESFIERLKNFTGDVLISSFSKRGEIYRSAGHYFGGYSQHVLYDSVLFSGLVFRNSVISLDQDELSLLGTSIYTQVYLVSKFWRADSGYFTSPFIVAGEDGENYFGKSESSQEQTILSDRSHHDSNLAYQERFQKISLLGINRYHPSLEKAFLHSYSLRLISHFFRVKLNNPSNFWDSFSKLSSRDLNFYKYVYPLVFLIGILPSFSARYIYQTAISKLRISGG